MEIDTTLSFKDKDKIITFDCMSDVDRVDVWVTDTAIKGKGRKSLVFSMDITEAIELGLKLNNLEIEED